MLYFSRRIPLMAVVWLVVSPCYTTSFTIHQTNGQQRSLPSTITNQPQPLLAPVGRVLSSAKKDEVESDDEWHPRDPASTTPQLLAGLWHQIAQSGTMTRGVGDLCLFVCLFVCVVCSYRNGHSVRGGQPRRPLRLTFLPYCYCFCLLLRVLLVSFFRRKHILSFIPKWKNNSINNHLVI